MCGIIAFLSKNIEAYQYLIDGLTILQNRGYDSAGICTIDSANHLINTKFASLQQLSAIDLLKTEDVAAKHKNNFCGIAHTRWATHGAKTDQNAHPHIDCKNRIAVVHNGIIENYRELKEKLIKNGFTFSSETDTEIIANLISFHLDQNSNDIWKSINAAINELNGTWGLAILYNEYPKNIFVCKNGSPLLIAYNSDYTIIASEASAFSKYTNKYIVLHDNEIIQIGVGLENNTDLFTNYEIKTLEKNDDIKLSPDPYKHWMLKEISEQPDSALKAINMGGRISEDNTIKLGGLRDHIDSLKNITNLLIVSSGTSYHAGLLGEKFFRLLKCFQTVNVIEAAEFTINDIPNVSNTNNSNTNSFTANSVGMIVLSQSGETKDVHRAMEIARSQNIIIIGVVNVVGSLIARDSTCGVYLNAGREVSVASTKSFTSQVIVLLLIALWFSQNNNFELKYRRGAIVNDIRNVSMNIADIIRNFPSTVPDEFIKNLANSPKAKNMFILGRGLAYPIAVEGALKIKEVSYIHAEGYAGGALKHGPFALIENGMPIILIILDDEHAEKMNICLEEVKTRGAYTIVITNIASYKKNNMCDHCILIPNGGILSSLLAIIPLQYISYRLAIEFGYNPDFPKNLAKCVVVD